MTRGGAILEGSLEEGAELGLGIGPWRILPGPREVGLEIGSYAVPPWTHHPPLDRLWGQRATRPVSARSYLDISP